MIKVRQYFWIVKKEVLQLKDKGVGWNIRFGNSITGTP